MLNDHTLKQDENPAKVGGGDNHQVQNFNTPIWDLINTINTRTLTPKVTLYLENNPPPLENEKKNPKSGIFCTFRLVCISYSYCLTIYC